MEKQNKILQKGESFGELALKKGLSGQMRQATAVAMDDCHFAILNKESYDVFLVYDIAHTRRHKQDKDGI